MLLSSIFTPGQVSVGLIIFATIAIVISSLSVFFTNISKDINKTECINLEGTIISVYPISPPNLVQSNLLTTPQFSEDEMEKMYEYQFSIRCLDFSLQKVHVNKDLFESVYKDILEVNKKIKAQCERKVFLNEIRLVSASLC